MSRVLFVTWAGGGNLAPALGIARSLSTRGHEVAFLGHSVQQPAFKPGPFAFETFRHAAPWPPARPVDPSGPPPSVGVFTDRGIGRDLLERLEREPADLVVIDHLLWGALEAADRHGIRYATLVHTLYGQQSGTWSEGPGAEVARGFGFQPVQLWRAGRVALVVTLREVDPAAAAADGCIQTGPVWQGRPEPARPEPVPLILVGLSTVPQDGQADALQAILDALAPLPVRVVLTTGQSVDPAQLRVPANAEVARYLPHEQVMPRASLVISHGGHSTAMAALARDLPMLLMPMFMLGDQPVVAGTLEALGAALALDKASGADAIRAAVERLLSDPAHRRAAARLGARIRERDGAEIAADALVSVLAGDRAAAR